MLSLSVAKQPSRKHAHIQDFNLPKLLWQPNITGHSDYILQPLVYYCPSSQTFAHKFTKSSCPNCECEWSFGSRLVITSQAACWGSQPLQHCQYRYLTFSLLLSQRQTASHSHHCLLTQNKEEPRAGEVAHVAASRYYSIFTFPRKHPNIFDPALLLFTCLLLN